MNGAQAAGGGAAAAGAPPSLQEAYPSNANGSSPSAAINGVVFDGPSNRTDVFDLPGGARILCVADIRGKISKLNDLAKQHNAAAIIHTGDFGFYDRDSIERITDRTLRHLVQYTSLIDNLGRDRHFPTAQGQALSLGQMREKLLNPPPELIQDLKRVNPQSSPNDFLLSEFPKLLSGEIKLSVPVYAVYGACEDVAIIEKLRLAPLSHMTNVNQQAQQQQVSKQSSASSEYSIPNLALLSESQTRLVVLGGLRLRLFGLGGSVVGHKMFDNGEGNATIAGANGTMWTTALQIGELIDTAQRVYDQTETRLLVTHASVGREGLLAQLALAVKADFTVSASLHFRYGSSYNDFSTQPDSELYRLKFVQANRGFMDVYESVKAQVEKVIDDNQKKLLKNAVAVASRIPAEHNEEPAWRNSWHWNLPDAAYGSLLLDIREGRVGADMRSTGFNFAYRLKGNPQPLPPLGSLPQQQQQQQVQQAPLQAPRQPTPAGLNATQSQQGPFNQQRQPSFQSNNQHRGEFQQRSGPQSQQPQQQNNSFSRASPAPALQKPVAAPVTTATSDAAKQPSSAAIEPPVDVTSIEQQQSGNNAAPTRPTHTSQRSGGPSSDDFANLSSSAFRNPSGVNRGGGAHGRGGIVRGAGFPARGGFRQDSPSGGSGGLSQAQPSATVSLVDLHPVESTENKGEVRGEGEGSWRRQEGQPTGERRSNFSNKQQQNGFKQRGSADAPHIADGPAPEGDRSNFQNNRGRGNGDRGRGRGGRGGGQQRQPSTSGSGNQQNNENVGAPATGGENALSGNTDYAEGQSPATQGSRGGRGRSDGNFRGGERGGRGRGDFGSRGRGEFKRGPHRNASLSEGGVQGAPSSDKPSTPAASSAPATSAATPAPALAT